MEGNELTYINVLIDSLKKKIGILDTLRSETEKQEQLLEKEDLDFDAFNAAIFAKEKALERLAKLDEGFLEIFEKVRETLKQNSSSYEKEIEYMKELVRKVTDYSTALTALEERNKTKLSVHLSRSRRKIKDYKQSSKTVAAYYKNMANGRTPEGSYFYDRKK